MTAKISKSRLLTRALIFLMALWLFSLAGILYAVPAKNCTSGGCYDYCFLWDDWCFGMGNNTNNWHFFRNVCQPFSGRCCHQTTGAGTCAVPALVDYQLQPYAVYSCSEDIGLAQ